MDNSLTDDEVSQRYEELIRLILAPTELPADEFVSAFHQAVMETQENYPTADHRQSCETTFLLSFNHRFDDRPGSDYVHVSFYSDHKEADQLQWRGNSMAEQLGLPPDFEWDWEAAMERCHSGGIPPVDFGMIAFDEWLEPRGFRFIAVASGNDGNNGFPIRAADHERALDLADELGMDACEPIRGLDIEVELSRLDADKIRSAKFPRAIRGLDPSAVVADLEAIATRIENRVPTVKYLVQPDRTEISQAPLRLGGVDKSAYEAFLVDLLDQMQG